MIFIFNKNIMIIFVNALQLSVAQFSVFFTKNIIQCMKKSRFFNPNLNKNPKYFRTK